MLSTLQTVCDCRESRGALTRKAAPERDCLIILISPAIAGITLVISTID
jgi:hypothetical protein